MRVVEVGRGSKGSIYVVYRGSKPVATVKAIRVGRSSRWRIYDITKVGAVRLVAEVYASSRSAVRERIRELFS